MNDISLKLIKLHEVLKFLGGVESNYKDTNQLCLQ